jgi:NCAIR mutase (PurE)-related protein
MDTERLRGLLADLQRGSVTLDDAMERLRTLPYDDMGFARLDVHRAVRQGLPEVVFCQGKTTDQAAAILARLWQHHDKVLGTRMSADMAASIQAKLPEAHYDPISRLMTLARTGPAERAPDAPFAMVVSGGTADLPVAEEAAQTLEFLGSPIERAYDVGVAGLHRLLDQIPRLMRADVIISVAGMEGALTSVVGGLASCPVIGVPTSVGYGASFGGVAALLSMLNSCAPGVAVVNIDNGFGAAVYAHLILSRISRRASLA